MERVLARHDREGLKILWNAEIGVRGEMSKFAFLFLKSLAFAHGSTDLPENLTKTRH